MTTMAGLLDRAQRYSRIDIAPGEFARFTAEQIDAIRAESDALIAKVDADIVARLAEWVFPLYAIDHDPGDEDRTP